MVWLLLNLIAFQFFLKARYKTSVVYCIINFFPWALR